MYLNVMCHLCPFGAKSENVENTKTESHVNLPVRFHLLHAVGNTWQIWHSLSQFLSQRAW